MFNCILIIKNVICFIGDISGQTIYYTSRKNKKIDSALCKYAMSGLVKLKVALCILQSDKECVRASLKLIVETPRNECAKNTHGELII